MRYSWSMLALVAALLPMIVGCAGMAKAPNEDVKLGREALAEAEAIRAAYVTRDLDAMERHCTPDGFRRIVRSMKEFEGASLQLTPRWIEVTGERSLAVKFAWQGKWRLKDGTEREESGIALFGFTGRPLRLDRVGMNDPFAELGDTEGTEGL